MPAVLKKFFVKKKYLTLHARYSMITKVLIQKSLFFCGFVKH